MRLYFQVEAHKRVGYARLCASLICYTQLLGLAFQESYKRNFEYDAKTIGIHKLPVMQLQSDDLEVTDDITMIY